MSPPSATDLASVLYQSQGVELIYGVARPAVTSALAPKLVPHLTGMLNAAVSPELTVLPCPSHVVLDGDRSLAVKPDLVVVRASEAKVIDGQVWCIPRIVVDVVCTRTARRIRLSRVRWYRLYGVAECWIVDTRRHRVEVHDFASLVESVPHICSDLVESKELGPVSLSVSEIFQDEASQQPMPAETTLGNRRQLVACGARRAGDRATERRLAGRRAAQQDVPSAPPQADTRQRRNSAPQLQPRHKKRQPRARRTGHDRLAR
jgi:Uma2 family endonuclease